MDTDITSSAYGKKVNKDIGQDKPTVVAEETAKFIPNVGFLGVALASMAGSAFLTFGARKKELGTFVGLWVPTLLIFGLYNKIVKLEDELMITRH
jgi:hypothetical protein